MSKFKLWSEGLLEGRNLCLHGSKWLIQNVAAKTCLVSACFNIQIRPKMLRVPAPTYPVGAPNTTHPHGISSPYLTLIIIKIHFYYYHDCLNSQWGNKKIQK